MNIRNPKYLFYPNFPPSNFRTDYGLSYGVGGLHFQITRSVANTNIRTMVIHYGHDINRPWSLLC